MDVSPHRKASSKQPAYFVHRHNGSIWIVCLTLLALLVLFLLNTAVIRNNLYREAEIYMSDLSREIAGSITARLQNKMTYISGMATTLSNMPDRLLTSSLMSRWQQTMTFDRMFVLYEDGRTFPDDFTCDYLLRWRAENPTCFEEPLLTAIPNHKLYFSAPLDDADGRRRVLIGVNGYEGIQAKLDTISFRGSGAALIVDQQGRVISATADNPIPALLQSARENPANAPASMQLVLAHIAQHQSCMLHLRDLGNAPLLVSCSALEGTSWMLLTVLPQNILMSQSLSPVYFYLVLILICAAVFIGLMFYIIRSRDRIFRQMEDIAFTDPLTGGMNNQLFQSRCRERLSQRLPESYAIVFLNVRNFKRINESWGVNDGNRTLRYLYSTLQASLREGELLTRSEVDHFFLMLRGSTQEDFSSRIRDIIDRLNDFGQEAASAPAYRFALAVGVYIIDEDGSDIRLFQDRARHASAFHHEPALCAFYDHQLAARQQRHARLNDMFDDALQHHDFQVYLQPKVPLRPGEPCGAEALVRWIHPIEGMISPGEFIPLFEQNGNICKLDLYVFEEVCKLMNHWRQTHQPLRPISVNLSRAHLKNLQVDFLQPFFDLKAKYAIPDDLLELELTESMMIDSEQVPLVQKIIRRLRAGGFHVSLDDFGYGYSSLALLKYFDVTAIKLDRQFFLQENEKTWIIVAGFIRLSHELGMQVIAEGIEEKAQVEHLREIGCDRIQGFYFSRPLPIPDFEIWLQHHNPENNA